jgi:hypothetical protein
MSNEELTAEIERLREVNTELLGCVLDVLDADGDLYAMDFNRYRAAIAKATEDDDGEKYFLREG